MPSTATSRRVTRSQTSSVLGKRSSTSLSRSSSVASLKSTISLPTPDPTPNPKRVRVVSGEVDDDSNKENIPPIRCLRDESPAPTRATRRASMELPSSPTRPRHTPNRRSSTAAIPRTPCTALAQLTLVTPPPTPPTPASFDARIRASLRSMSNSTHAMSMSGREKERAIMERFLRSFDNGADDSETILYISGSPGTGKTALVNNILASSVFEDDTKVVFVNCMACSGIDVFWERLGEELSGEDAKSGRKGKAKKSTGKEYVIKLLDELNTKCIVILDELDHLASSSTALQSFFSFAISSSAALRIIGIANTHTLTSLSSPSNILPPSLTSLSSASKVKTIHFAPYTPSELLAILQTRLASLPQDDLKKSLPLPALTLLTKKVAALTGDVRVVFEVLRNAIDLALPVSSPSSTFASAGETVNVPFTVTPKHILAALKSYTPSSLSASLSSSKSGSGDVSNSETASKVRSLGLQARLVLLALLLASKRLWSGLVLSPSSSSYQAKRSPIKRTLSSASATHSSRPDGTAASQGVDATQLHTYYCVLLRSADAFTPVSRSEFADLLGVLETTGLVALSASRAGGAGGARTFKRSASFAGKMKAAAGGAGAAQEVRLVGDVREAEVRRGLGIGLAAADAQGQDGVIGDVREEEVSAIWEKEVNKIKREVKAISRDSAKAEIADAGFDDAMED